jgi:hypothetical protein
MFARLTNLVRKSIPSATPAPAPRRAAIETLEGRELYSVSPMGQLPAVQQPTAVERQATVQLPAVQSPASTNIIAILIGL